MAATEEMAVGRALEAREARVENQEQMESRVNFNVRKRNNRKRLRRQPEELKQLLPEERERPEADQVLVAQLAALQPRGEVRKVVAREQESKQRPEALKHE